MKISANYKRVLDNIYSNQKVAIQNEFSGMDSTVSNVFGKFVTVKCLGNLINVPLFCRYSIEKLLMSLDFLGDEFENIAININVEGNYSLEGEEEKSAYAIIKKFFTSYRLNTLKKGKTVNGEIYYGGRGIILDSNFNPLFFAFATIDTSNLYSYNKIIIYIDKKVHDSKDSVSKEIVKKLIPYYSNTPVYLFTSHNSFRRTLFPEIIITDLSNFIKTVDIPKYTTNLQNELTEVVINNIDEVFKFKSLVEEEENDLNL